MHNRNDRASRILVLVVTMPDTAERQRKVKFEYSVRVLNLFRKPIRALLEANGIPKKEYDYYWLMLNWITKGLMKSYKDTYMVTKKPPKASEWFCRLYSKIMDDAMGHKYIDVLENLMKWGVVVRGASYCKSEDGLPGKCKAVWFTAEYGYMLKNYCYAKDIAHLYGKGYFKAGSMYSSKIKSPVLLKRLEKCAAERKTVQMDDPVVKDAHDNLLHFHVDRKLAMKALVELNATKDDKNKMSKKRIEAELRKVDRFNDAGKSETALFVVRDDYGRVHTNMTQMKKDIRKKAMTCDGEPVSSVDIKSSQGAFLCYILDACISGNPVMLGRKRGSFISIEPGIVDQIGREELWRELCMFREKLRRKELYEFFMDEMQAYIDIEREDGQKVMKLDRDEAKHAFLVHLFSGIELSEDCNDPVHACRRVWEEHFPKLLQLVNYLKRDNYRAMAYELQRMESSFVFDAVVPRIKSDIRCPYCTVHDEIIVPSRYVMVVQRILEEELEKFGIPTTTEAENCIIEPDDATMKAEMPSYAEVRANNGWGDAVDMRITEDYIGAVG